MKKDRELIYLRKLAGKYSGILTDRIYYFPGNNIGSRLNICTAILPNYEKKVSSLYSHASYHLSGYGDTFKDSLIRMEGEAVERYAGIVSHKYLADRIFKSSYKEINGLKPDIQLLNPYTNAQINQISKIIYNFRDRPLREEDVISWVNAKSIFYPEKDVVVPASSFFIGFDNNELRNNIGVSTGTATFSNVSHALENSVIEYLQIDAFMSAWYSQEKIPTIILKDYSKHIQELVKNKLGVLDRFYCCYLIDLTPFSKVKLNVYGVFLVAKNNDIVPAISFGLQGGFNKENTIIRSFYEALANLKMEEDKYIFCSGKYKDVDINKIVNMDDNVDYFANNNHFEQNIDYLGKRLKLVKSFNKEKELVNNLKTLMEKLKDVAPMSCFLDITPPYLAIDFRVIRVYIPELMVVTFPSFPQMNLPSFLGGKNEKYYIHPMP
ncbi:YcaO-like family protein [Lactobacillus johnsonii]